MAMDSIQKRISRAVADEKSKLTKEELFRSAEFSRHLEDLVRAVLSPYKASASLDLAWENGSSTAYTDGRNIHQNLNCELVMQYEDLYAAYCAQLGLAFHECSHILWHDFTKDGKARDTLEEEGLLTGQLPDTDTDEELDEFLRAVKDEGTRPIFVRLYDDLTNILIDPHDENKSIDRYGGLVEQSIVVLRTALQRAIEPFETVVAQPHDKLEVMYNLVLQFARFGEIVCDDLEKAREHEYVQTVFELAPIITAAVGTDRYTELLGYVNQIVYTLWRLIKDEMSQQKDPSGGGNDAGEGGQNGPPQSGENSDPASNAVQNILNKLEAGAKNAGTSVAPKNRATNRTAQKGDGGVPAGGASEAAAQSDLSSLLNAIAQDRAEEKVKKEVLDEMCKEINALDRSSSHKNFPLSVERPGRADAIVRKRYTEMMEGLKPYSRKLQKLIFEALRDLKDGCITHKRSFGRIVEAKYGYRPDEKYFANKKLPQDLPDMSVCVLIDHSGSMSGERIAASSKAAMLLYDFATASDIPVCVLGHCTCGNRVDIKLYTTFDKVNDSEKYPLANMQPYGCNRDGAAIEVATAMLAKRPEEVKLLIVISDGQPNHTNYGGKAAMGDIQTIVRKGKKMGVETIALAIGSDKERIREIYGADNFVDIADLSALPKTMANIVKKRVIPN